MPDISTALVRRLLDTQFPAYAHLPLRLLDPAGSDHVIHRLGDDLSVRLPRHSGAIGQAEKDLYWLPRLAPRLPLAVPVPVAVGRPDFGYPWSWAISRWLDGQVATDGPLGDDPATAVALAEFLVALQSLPVVEGRPELADGPITDRDRTTRTAISATGGVFDAGAMTAVWDAALNADGWDRPPVWFHGDFHTGNLLTSGGRLSAVIDFGGLGIGDPAGDLTIAFTLLSADTRPVFREALGVDDATWARGRGHALAGGLNAYTSYAATNPHIAAVTTRQILAAIRG